MQTINLEIKFPLNSKVFFLKGGKIAQSTVAHISVEIAKEQTSISYLLEDDAANPEDAESRFGFRSRKFPEKLLFGSPAELVSSLTEV